jgi:hypothetical protein
MNEVGNVDADLQSFIDQYMVACEVEGRPECDNIIPSCLTLFRLIAVFCGTDNIMRNILSFNLNVGNIMWD